MDVCDNHAVLGEIRARHPTAMAKHRRLHPESRAAPAGAALRGVLTPKSVGVGGQHSRAAGCRTRGHRA